MLVIHYLLSQPAEFFQGDSRKGMAREEFKFNFTVTSQN
jgi:hypothetical protein